MICLIILRSFSPILLIVIFYNRVYILFGVLEENKERLMFPQELINAVPVPADLPADITVGVDRTEDFSHDDVGLFLRGKRGMEGYCLTSVCGCG